MDEYCGIKYHHYLKLGGKISLDSDIAKRANPKMYINKETPPFLLLHGENDTCVPISRGEEMYNALEEKGVDVTLVRIPGAGHADIRFFQPEIMDIIGNFFDKILKR